MKEGEGRLRPTVELMVISNWVRQAVAHKGVCYDRWKTGVANLGVLSAYRAL